MPEMMSEAQLHAAKIRVSRLNQRQWSLQRPSGYRWVHPQALPIVAGQTTEAFPSVLAGTAQIDCGAIRFAYCKWLSTNSFAHWRFPHSSSRSTASMSTVLSMLPPWNGNGRGAYWLYF